MLQVMDIPLRIVNHKTCAMDLVPYLPPICQCELVKAILQLQPAQVQIEEKKHQNSCPTH